MVRQAPSVRRVRKWIRQPSWGSVHSTGSIGLGIVVGLIVLGATMLLLQMIGR